MKKIFVIFLMISLFIGCDFNFGKKSFIFSNTSSKTLNVTHSNNLFRNFNISPNSRKNIYVDADYLFTNHISATISDDSSLEARIEEGSAPNEIELIYKELDEVIRAFLSEEPRIVAYETSFPDTDVCTLSWDIRSEPYIADWFYGPALLQKRYYGEMNFVFSATGGWDINGGTSAAVVEFLNYV